MASSISWKVGFETFWMNYKTWLNAEVYFLPLNFSWDKSLTTHGGVLADVHPEIELQIGSLRGVIVIKIKC